MSDRKLAKAVRTLIRQVSRLSRSMTKALMTWLLRLALVGNRRRRYATGGFVLPTTVMLILVVSLTTGALTYRAFSSSTRTIGETQNRVIYNAATPAVDRARAKLDYLFDDKKDPRYPGGVPSVNFLTSMLLNRDVDSTGNGAAVIGGVKVSSKATTTGLISGDDPYTFPDERRLDISDTKDGKADNAWWYRADTDGNGSPDATIVYSIVFATPNDQAVLLQKGDREKVEGEKLDPGDTDVIPFVRNGPLSNAKASGCGGSTTAGKTKVEGGWYQDPTNTSILRKNFQIDALVIPDGKGADPANPTAATVPGALSTLELQQDRQISRGNKWGAWFRNDLEIFPGGSAKFNWNGAMHTEGSLIVGGTNVEAYLVSAPASCLFYESASEISVTKSPEKTTFTGIVVSGKILENQSEGNNKIHIHKPSPTVADLNPGTDSSNGKLPADIALNPEELQKNNGYKAMTGPSLNNLDGLDKTRVDPGQEFLTPFDGRIRMKPEKAPYVDDGYRADDRYGPKQKYNADISIPSGSKVGDPITTATAGTNKEALVGNSATGTDKSAVGLDGYWERRGRNEGLRILVGQRLELGNAFGWVAPQNRPASKQDPAATPAAVTVEGFSDFRNNGYTATYNAPTSLAKFGATTPLAERPDPDTSDNEGDPLYPPTETLSHEAQQRRALRDNLSAVQGMVVYHAAVGADLPGDLARDRPIACVATTSHFGSPFAIERSINFVPTTFKSGSANTDLLVDFFNGRGTNGMEFTPPTVADITSSTSAMGIALRNLANFAGDPDGAYPPKQEAGKIHPDPYQTMWGNFSNLKRAIALLDAGGYVALSPADKSYLHTAACTLGMLAYNVDTLQKFDPTSADNSAAMASLGGLLAELLDGNVENGEVLPKEQLSTFGYSNTGTYDQEKYNPRDYDRVPAEAFLGKIREMRLGGGGSIRKEEDSVVRLAELVFTAMQVRRDRTYGFRPSPAANTWNYNPFVIHDPVSTSPARKPLLWSSACDPNLFAVGTGDGLKTGAAGAALIPYADGQQATLGRVERQRLGLSRLCGTVLPSGAVHDFPGDTKYPARDGAEALTTNLPKKNDGTGTFKTMTPATDSLNFPFEPAVDPTFAAALPAATPLKDISETKPYTLAQVTPKWPALYYVFPEFEHDHDGKVDPLTSGSPLVVDHRQPGNTTDVSATLTARLNALPAAFQPWEEPYITKVTTTYTYKPVQAGTVTGYNAAQGEYTANSVFLSGSVDPSTTPGYDARGNVQLAYKTFGGFLPNNLPVSGLALTPVTNTSSSKLPIDDPTGAVLENIKPNRILMASGVKVVPFLDRVLFNGREGLPSRVLDLDIGMLRRTRPADQVKGNTEYAPGDVWLPASGLVYAFREDAVREDDINRPSSTTACVSTDKPCTNATVPGSETDPPLADFGVSLKPVDFVADPLRRSHGFRLRNATQLRRHKDMVSSGGDEFTEDKNIRGIDLVSDNSVYVMGPYNLHQDDNKGSKEDDGDPDLQDTTQRIEEFTERLPSDSLYDYDKFYKDRKTTDDRFADPAKDRWRPSAILADATVILSDNFCDGSAIDNFMTAGAGIRDVNISSTTYSGSATTAPNADNLSFVDNFYPYGRRAAATFKGPAVYNDSSKALYAPGCTDGKRTSFLNQNRPETQPPAGWSWARENPADIFSPVKISRNGNGFLIPPARTVAPTPDSDASKTAAEKAVEKMIAQKPRVMADYDIGVLSGNTYYTSEQASQGGDKRAIQEAKSTRVNTILVSGIVPSRAYQSYGGMHNFPRFLENWGEKFSATSKSLWFAGSFLQLSFSNAATSPFDIVVTEPTGTKPGSANQQIPYYEPPNRLWGYDPALLLAPAGPIASRFVSTDIVRSEFYSEVAANDPYIKMLCTAVATGSTPIVKNLKCPT
jgi:hypothetical protein